MTIATALRLPGLDDLAPITAPVSQIVLRDYQVAAVDAINAAEARGVRRQLMVLPTAAGKTVCFSEIARQRLPGRTLILSHRDELVRQAADKFRMVSGGVPVGIVKAETHEPQYPVVSASVQTLTRRIDKFPRDWRMVVVDEAHHSTADSYRRILDALGAGESDGPLLVGVTATADRADGKGLESVYDEIVYEAKLLDLVRRKYISDIRGLRVRVDMDLDALRTSHGDYQADDLGDAMTRAHAAEAIAGAITRHAQGRRCLAFTPTVATSQELVVACTAVGLRAVHVDGTTPDEQRRDAIGSLQDHHIDLVSNCGVFLEGTDIPAVDCVVVARPTKSRPLYAQMVGRGFRIFPGKNDCLILDLCGVSQKHKLVTLASLIGKPQLDRSREEVVTAGGGVTEGKEGPSLLDILRAEDGPSVEEVDLFAGSWAAWITLAGGQFLLPAGDESYVLHPYGDGRYDVFAETKGDREPLLIASGLDVGYAQGVAEQRAASVARNLVDKSATWRFSPPSDKQLDILERAGIDTLTVLTKGEASQLISKLFAEKRGRR